MEETFRAGISLHSHTMFSEETLAIVPRYTSRLPYLGRRIQKEQREYSARRGQRFDFNHAYWTPPLTPSQAYRLEEKQIQRRFELPAFVSLSDHDDIRAAGSLHVMNRFRDAPISTEWTVPFGETFFHLGIHNLPQDRARALHSLMEEYTLGAQPSLLVSVLETLAAIPHVLIVLNHPLWDEKGIGKEEHWRHLGDLLRTCRSHIHAVEVNGLRSRRENAEAATLARSLNLPTVGGGDRHGREPNAVLNLSRATTFEGFVEEIRYARRSHVVFMPQYQEPLRLRMLQTMADVVRHYPENAPGRRQWSERIFVRQPDGGEAVPLSVFWQDGGPPCVRQFVAITQIAGSRKIRPLLRIALHDLARGRLNFEGASDFASGADEIVQAGGIY